MSTDAPDPPAPDRSIPYARFERVVAERNTLKTQLDDLAEQVQTLSERSATADTLASQLRDAQADAASARSRFDSYRTIAGAGITDPDLVEAVEWQYGRLPAEERPALAEVLSGWSATPDEAPAILRPVFQSLAAPVEASTPRAPRPPTPPTGGAAESGATDVSAEALAAARQSGDLARLGDLLRRGGYGRGLFSTTK